MESYIHLKSGTVRSVLDSIIDSIEDGRPESLMKSLDAYFAGVPYDMKLENENNFQNAFYILSTLIGIDAKVEVHTSDGRIDLLIENKKYIYIIEIKKDSTSAEALRQIEEKQYALRFSTDPRQLFKIGVNFSTTTRRLQSWLIDPQT